MSSQLKCLMVQVARKLAGWSTHRHSQHKKMQKPLKSVLHQVVQVISYFKSQPLNSHLFLLSRHCGGILAFAFALKLDVWHSCVLAGNYETFPKLADFIADVSGNISLRCQAFNCTGLQFIQLGSEPICLHSKRSAFRTA